MQRATLATASLAASFLLLLLLPSLSPHYGFYSDELYYLACAKRLAWGYVDHPPLFPFLLRLHVELFGDSIFALRLLPAAAGASTAFLAGSMAGRLGGGPFARLLATLATMMSPLALVLFGFFSVNCVEILLWTTASWLLLERCRSDEPRLWLALGAVLGLSLLTKHTSVVLIAGVAAATLLGPLRRDLRGPWPWLAALGTAAIVSPNLYWQAAHDWTSLAFYRTVAAENIRTSPLDVLLRQVFYHNPAAFPIWAAGAFFYLRAPSGRRFRPLGWLFLTVLVVAMALGRSRPDRIAGIYPVALSGGAVLLERLRGRGAGRWRRLWSTWTLPALLVAIGGAAATLTLPILPPSLLASHPLYDGEEDWRREPGPQKLPYHLANRTHWPALVAEVADVIGDLDPAQRADAVLLTDYFGIAGALEYYGDGRGLPPVYSNHASYSLWGPPPGSPGTVVAVGLDAPLLEAHYEQVRLAATFRCRWCPWWQSRVPIHVATSPKHPFAALWRELCARPPMHRRAALLRAEEVE